MSFQPTHVGLYFTQNDIETARKEREKNDDLQTAWQWLLATTGDVIKEKKPQNEDDEPQQVIKPTLSPLAQLLNDALRYRFAEDKTAGERAVQVLQGGIGLQDAATFFDTVLVTLGAAHAFEMLRGNIPNHRAWLASFETFSASLLQAADDVPYLEKLWLITLNIVSGVVLEDQTRFDTGVTAFRQVIDQDLHPEGYVKPLVVGENNSEVAFKGMVLACAALTLAAEAATLAGENLWQYENRDVGINTAVTYLVYYYFYPKKWRWGEDELTEDQTQAIFEQMGAWIEISTRRANPRGVEILLEDRRPFFNASMGGLTTLTHFQTERRKKRGIFF